MGARGIVGLFERIKANLTRAGLVALLALGVALPHATGVADAGGGDRTLWLHHTHTGLTAKFTFKKNGKYDYAVLDQMNTFLADWRNKKPTKMDPHLFDLLWEVYQEVGANQPYNIVSAYRSPETNSMLRANSSGVAEHSQHMLGKAMDVFIPGVNLYKLRATAMRHQVGGVGYYPTSGSPFVHMDTGNVRAWPRMTRAQLAKLFPDGKTLHLPVDGKPLSDSGRAYAMAQWQQCKTVPCGRGDMIVAQPDDIQVASADSNTPASVDAPIPVLRPRDSEATLQLASADDPAQRVVSTIAVNAPLPLYRPKSFESADTSLVASIATDENDDAAWQAAGAPLPVSKSERIRLATTSVPSGKDGETALAALDSLDPLPQPRVLMTPKSDEMLTAYASSGGSETALRTIIDQSQTAVLASLPMKPTLPLSGSTAKAGGSALDKMFDGTFGALDRNGPADVAEAVADLARELKPNPSIQLAEIEFVAPETDHVNETLVEPQLLTAGFWADLTEPEGYLDKGTQLGPLTGQVGFIRADAAVPAYDRFIANRRTLQVAGL